MLKRTTLSIAAVLFLTASVCPVYAEISTTYSPLNNSSNSNAGSDSSSSSNSSSRSNNSSKVSLSTALLQNLLGPGIGAISSLGPEGIKNLLSASPEIQSLIDAGGEAAEVINHVLDLGSNVLAVVSDLNNLKNALLSAPEAIKNQFMGQIDGFIGNLTNQIFNLGTFDLASALESFDMGSLGNLSDILSGDLSGVTDMLSGLLDIPGLSEIPGLSDALSALTGSTSAASAATSSLGSGDSSSGDLVADINKAYPNERKYIQELSSQVSATHSTQTNATKLAQTASDNQSNNQSSMMTAQEQTGVLSKQVANYTRMEIQRSEAILLQTKEMIFEIWSMSSEISKKEIEENLPK